MYPKGSSQGIHVFNTHLQATYDLKDFEKVSEIRAKQAVEIIEYMKEKVQNNPDPALRNFPVILAGDFNENARPRNNLCDRSSQEDFYSTPEYVRLIKTLTMFTGEPPVDNLLATARRHGDPEHPITFADTTGPQRDEVCTEKHFYADKYVENSRLDYLFMWPGKAEPDEAVFDFDPTKIDAVVEKLSHKPDWYFPGTQLSDHYGIASAIPVSTKSFGSTPNTTATLTPEAGSGNNREIV